MIDDDVDFDSDDNSNYDVVVGDSANDSHDS
jgi:hypothetical protein